MEKLKQHGIKIGILTDVAYGMDNDHTYQLVRLNDYPHLRELQTIGYEKWGLFAERDYWVKQTGF